MCVCVCVCSAALDVVLSHALQGLLRCMWLQGLCLTNLCTQLTELGCFSPCLLDPFCWSLRYSGCILIAFLEQTSAKAA